MSSSADAPAATPAALFAGRPAPPYYAVIFTSLRKPVEHEAYGDMAAQMVALAAQQPGYLGMESVRGDDGLGITVSYWRTAEDIQAWRRHVEHTQARDAGRARWYSHYELRVAKVERAYGWDAAEPAADPMGLAG